MRNSACLLVLFILIPLLSCAEKSASDLHIVGGRKPVELDDSGVRSVVAITEAGRQICSGTLITQSTVLTAAHCFSRNLTLDKLGVVFGNSLKDPNRMTREVSHIHSFKGYGAAEFPMFDIAVLELKEEAPTSFVPLDILSDPGLLPNGTDWKIAGFGQTSSDCEGTEKPCNGEKFEAFARYDGYLDWGPYFSLVRVKAKEPVSGTCAGDSGGPLLIRVGMQWKLAGVLNGATRIHTPLAYRGANQDCESGHDLFTFAGDYLPWINSIHKNPLVRDVASPIKARVLVAQHAQPQCIKEWVRFDDHNSNFWPIWRQIVDSILLKENIDPFSMNKAALERLVMQRLSTLNSLSLSGPAGADQLLLLHDIGVLNHLKNLQSLDLYNLDLSSSEASKSLSRLKLKQLKLSNVLVEDASSIPYQDLDSLTLYSVQIGRIGNLQDVSWDRLGNLKKLILKDDKGIDLGMAIPWSQLKSLHETVLLGYVSSLEDLPGNLKSLSFQAHDVMDLSSLKNLINLEEVRIDAYVTLDLNSLSLLPHLRSLELANTSAEEIKPLKDLKLETLSLSLFQTEMLSIKELIRQFGSSISELRLENCQLADVELLRNFPNLKLARMRNCYLDSIPEFNEASVLQFLDLSLNRISSLKGISSLGKLTFLDLSDNSISDISEVRHLKLMRDFRASNNKIVDGEPLAGLEKLESVNLSFNPLTELPKFQSKEMRLIIAQKTKISSLTCPVETARCEFSRDITFTSQSTLGM